MEGPGTQQMFNKYKLLLILFFPCSRRIPLQVSSSSDVHITFDSHASGNDSHNRDCFSIVYLVGGQSPF